MMEDIEKLLDRGEEFQLLDDKTENLHSPAEDFTQQGDQMRRKLWLQKMRITFIVLGMVVALILIIIISICGGYKC